MAVEPFECKLELNKLLRTKSNVCIISADIFNIQPFRNLLGLKLKKTHITIIPINQYILSKVNSLKLKIPCSEHCETILTLPKSVLHAPPVYI